MYPMAKAIGYAAKGKHSPLRPHLFDRREPGKGDVVIDVLFCGVCHSDLHQVKNDWGNTLYPCIPGHEVVGRVARVGAAVESFKAGDLVGVGCMVDSCGECRACHEGLEQYCEGPKGFVWTCNGPARPDGTNTFGGYSSAIVVREKFVLPIPEGMDPKLAAPLLCAGVTTFSPMKHWGVGNGQKVAIAGFGGLGHLATQLAQALGARVTVLTTSRRKLEDARRLGAEAAVLSTDEEAMKELEGSFDFLLSTIPRSHDVAPFVATLRRDGVMAVCGALEPFAGVSCSSLAFHRQTLAGSLIGGLAETREVLEFCLQHGIAPQVQLIPVDDINDAFTRLDAREVRYRCVIDMSTLTS